MHCLVPQSLQNALVFDHQHVALHSLLTAAYVHLNDAPLFGNLLGYLLTALCAYLLCLAVDERR